MFKNASDIVKFLKDNGFDYVVQRDGAYEVIKIIDGLDYHHIIRDNEIRTIIDPMLVINRILDRFNYMHNRKLSFLN